MQTSDQSTSALAGSCISLCVQSVSMEERASGSLSAHHLSVYMLMSAKGCDSLYFKHIVGSDKLTSVTLKPLTTKPNMLIKGSSYFRVLQRFAFGTKAGGGDVASIFISVRIITE